MHMYTCTYACLNAHTHTHTHPHTQTHPHTHTYTHTRLHLPGELVDDDRQKASYDIDSGGQIHTISLAGSVEIVEREILDTNWTD